MRGCADETKYFGDASSGASAVTYSVLNLTNAGDNLVALSTLYGGTFALFAHTLKQFNIEVRFVDPAKPEDLARHVDENTKLVFGETVGNPALNVIDLDALHLRRPRMVHDLPAGGRRLLQDVDGYRTTIKAGETTVDLTGGEGGGNEANQPTEGQV